MREVTIERFLTLQEIDHRPHCQQLPKVKPGIVNSVMLNKQTVKHCNNTLAIIIVIIIALSDLADHRPSLSATSE